MLQNSVFEAVIKQAIEWSAKFDFLKMFVPIVVSVFVFGLLARNIKKLVGPQGELRTMMNESLGAFRVELRALMADERRRHKAALVRDAKNVERSAAEESKKKTIASSISDAVQDVAVNSDGTIEDREDSQGNEKNWGELQAMWEQVWLWTKEQRKVALSQEKRSVVIGKLKNAKLQSPVEIISMLYRYGWHSDKASDLALKMAGMFNKYRTKKIAVDESAIQRFRELYSEWQKLDA